ncbi:hypothetical protein CRU94_00170 [Arcobacter sp. AHV-9/2010]|uniref:tetratricopeptide repeat protein n=1 Tax=Arcobacter sp. AHV-9/2010 TaxID=2021861 RepID=UPI00100B8EDF|nr:tetratricopeptide repeat protein [Arcobacter sp. CECT 9299]RXJ96566.1 hypothetical protein CRU94_00170 [Arcobacter sp. CECT 9299]
MKNFILFTILSVVLLGKDLGDGYRAYINKDYDKAIKIFKEFAENGNKNAQFTLGEIYFNGLGVKGNFKLAKDYYEKAANQGDLDAYIGLAKAYHNLGDEKKALEWYKNAALKEEPTAQESLGNFYHSGQFVGKIDEEASGYWHLKAFNNYMNLNYKNNKIQLRIANMYYYGNNAIEKNIEKAIEWYEKASLNGNVWSQNFLANIYDSGKVVPRDFQKAINLYNEACHNGSRSACSSYYYYLERGYIK